jgi:3-keto-5-aminohexanoate cleavage enzyme
MEDNIYLSKGVLTRSNAEMVQKVVRLIGDIGREPASPLEARRILGIASP